jgi:thiol-disulfide isomerase/thioredoxin
MSSYKKISEIGITKSNSYSSKKESFETKSVTVPSILSISDKTNVISNNKICLFYIYADWCGPCTSTKPIFDQLYEKYNMPGFVSLFKENVDLQLSQNIQAIPAFKFFVDGKEHITITGALMDDVEAEIVKLANNSKPQ